MNSQKPADSPATETLSNRFGSSSRYRGLLGSLRVNEPRLVSEQAVSPNLVNLQHVARNAARSIRKTPQDSRGRCGARTALATAPTGAKLFAEEIRGRQLIKAREVRGNASRVACRVISWRAIRFEGRGSGGFPWINPWTPHKSPAVSLLFSPIYIFACRWAPHTPPFELVEMLYRVPFNIRGIWYSLRVTRTNICAHIQRAVRHDLHTGV